MFELIDSPGLTQGSQSYSIVSVHKHEATGAKVRLRIKVDSYATLQSYAVAETWTAEGWKTVCSRDPFTWAEDAPSPYGRTREQEQAKATCLGEMEDDLLALANAILA